MSVCLPLSSTHPQSHPPEKGRTKRQRKRGCDYSMTVSPWLCLVPASWPLHGAVLLPGVPPPSSPFRTCCSYSPVGLPQLLLIRGALPDPLFPRPRLYVSMLLAQWASLPLFCSPVLDSKSGPSRTAPQQGFLTPEPLSPSWGQAYSRCSMETY